MTSPKITAPQGRIHVDGVATPFYVENGQLSETGPVVWYLQRPTHAHKAFAWHKRRRDVLEAAGVFIEGATRQPGESVAEMQTRALQLCLESGSRNVVPLRKELAA